MTCLQIFKVKIILIIPRKPNLITLIIHSARKAIVNTQSKKYKKKLKNFPHF